ncbi:4-hydroxybenzoyl-CoA thioesterase [Amycolatopsis coloradensis]|uniref:4-hydroxybenzoyl-CoA thioesterase n=1 Tax=Amycolatopsis coloradensis TaxID=76021 RepID=A0A1R0KZA5_9PSEU|nr:acyl-CoA thioesterase [Amycolatopsis coloradensis]OLZ54604.1 4-hydroxybenzoyl-CoA thioesterase [Amycolatopsis coloradensis]
MPAVYRHDHVVTLDETNLVGNVYFAHYLHWQGHCREFFLAEHAPGVLKSLRTGDFVMVTVSCSMDFYAECFALDEVGVEMTLRATSGNRIEMGFEFRRGATLAARGTQTVACMRRADGGVLPAGIPAELAHALADFS